MKDIEKIKNIVLFGETTLEDVFKAVYESSIEERNSAVATFQEFKNMVTGPDDLFMSGEKPAAYLEIAHKAMDNINKLLGVLPKICEIAEEKENSDKEFDKNQIIDILDQQNIGPKRMLELMSKS